MSESTAQKIFAATQALSIELERLGAVYLRTVTAAAAEYERGIVDAQQRYQAILTDSEP